MIIRGRFKFGDKINTANVQAACVPSLIFLVQLQVLVLSWIKINTEEMRGYEQRVAIQIDGWLCLSHYEQVTVQQM